MSLIQEALRRQQEEKEAAEQAATEPESAGSPAVEPETATPLTDDAPPALPAMPRPGATGRKLNLSSRAPMPSDLTDHEDTSADATAAEPPLRRTATEKTNRVLLPLLSVLLVLLLLAGLAVWAVLYGVQIFTRPGELEEPPTLVTPVRPAPDTPLAPPTPESEQVAHLASPPVPPTEPTQPLVAAATEPVAPAPPPAPVDTSVTEPPPAPTPPATQPETTPAPSPATVPQPPRPATIPSPGAPVPGTPPATPIIWPEVHVSGVIGAGSSGSAIINGKVVGLNENINDLTVRAFGHGFVVLEYQGETRRFPVGRPLR